MRLLSVLLIALFSITSWSQDEEIGHPLSVPARFQTLKIAPGSVTEVSFQVTLKDDYFAYLNQFKLLPLSPDHVKVSDLHFSPVVQFNDVVSKKKKDGIKKEALFKTQIEWPRDIPKNLKSFKFHFRYQACTVKFCLFPKKLEVEIPVKVVSADDLLSTSTRLDEGIKPSPGLSGLITKLKSQDLQNFVEALEQNLFLTLLLVFAFGILTAFTPCVYPMIPITLSIIGATPSESTFGHRLGRSLMYALGIIVVFTGLGLFSALTGQLFGQLLSHPAVQAGLGLLLVVMGLSMLGLFDLDIERFFPLSKKLSGPWWYKNFLIGSLAGVAASPCVGPVLFSVLTYTAKKQDPALGVTLLALYAIGFCVPLLTLALFAHSLKSLPRSGAWMKIPKVILGLFLIASSLYFFSPLFYRSNQKSELWQSYSESTIEEAKRNGKPVLIDFYADWCVACVQMENEVFSDPKVKSALNGWTLIKIDLTESMSEQDELLKKYNIQSLPVYLFYNKNGNLQASETLREYESQELFLKRLERIDRQ